MMRWLYSLLMWLAQPALRRKLARRGLQEPGYLVAVDERFGYYSESLEKSDPAPGRPTVDGITVWLHAVSLGETRAAAVLVQALRERIPGMRLLLTQVAQRLNSQGGEPVILAVEKAVPPGARVS